MGDLVENVLGGFGFGPGEEKDPFFGGKAVGPAIEAGEIQAQSAREALEETRRQFDITQAGLQPFQAAGVSALEEQRALLGLAEFQPEFQPEEFQLGPQIQPQIQSQPQIQPPRNGAGFRFVIPATQTAQQQPQPVLEQPVSEQQQQQPSEQELQAFRVQAQQDALNRIQESPGQKFLRDRAQRNLLRNASAIGGLGGGNVRSALVQQGIGFAQQDIQNRFGRLGQLAGQGQQATTVSGQLGAQASGNIANLIQTEGGARASGLLGGAQIQAQAQQNAIGVVGNVAGFLSDRRLKTNIKKVGQDEFGNIYQFRYINTFAEYIGRMAQELRDIRPDAVSIHPSGYLQVSAEFAPEVA